VAFRRVPGAWSSSLDDERSGWAVVSLRGSFDGLDAGVEVSALLFDLVSQGNLVLSIDAREVTELGPVTCRGLVAAADLVADSCGCLVISGLGARLRGMLGVFDERRTVHLARARP
jgi:hypothetical protein